MIAEIIIQKEAAPRQSNWRGLPLFRRLLKLTDSQSGKDSYGCYAANVERHFMSISRRILVIIIPVIALVA